MYVRRILVSSNFLVQSIPVWFYNILFQVTIHITDVEPSRPALPLSLQAAPLVFGISGTRICFQVFLNNPWKANTVQKPELCSSTDLTGLDLMSWVISGQVCPMNIWEGCYATAYLNQLFVLSLNKSWW